MTNKEYSVMTLIHKQKYNKPELYIWKTRKDFG